MPIVTPAYISSRATRAQQVATLRKRVRAKYGEHAYYWTVAAWEQVLEVFGWRCAYCGKSERDASGLAMDHYIPCLKGGKTTPTNIVPACLHCNSRKSDKLPWQWCGSAKHESISAILQSLRPKGDSRKTEYSLDNNPKFELSRSKPKRNKTMALLTKNTGNTAGEWELCPAGDFQLVVVDVVDLGWAEKIYKGASKGMKPFVQFVYQVGGTDENDEPVVRDDGSRFLVFGRKQLLSTDNRAGFYNEICGIMGQQFIEAQMEQGTLDTEDFIGRNVNAVIVHNKSEDGNKTFVNIESMKPWNKKFGPEIAPDGYTRRVDRDDWAEKAPAVSAFEDPAIAQRLLAETAGQHALLVEQSAQPRTTPQPRAAAPAPVDARLDNNTDTRKQTAKDLAAGYEASDGEELFGDDEEGTVEEVYGQQPLLAEAPAKAKKAAAYAAGK